MDGTEWLEEVAEDTTVDKLKEKCLKHVGAPGLFVSVCVPKHPRPRVCPVTSSPSCPLCKVSVDLYL